jgi:phosphatidate cytidylyltransferase
MSNSKVRILSALVMIVFLTAVIAMGKIPTLTLLLIVGILIIDELAVNFLKRERFSIFALISQLVFVAPFVFFNFIDSSQVFFDVFINSAVVCNILAVFYLFLVKQESTVLFRYLNKFPVLTGGYVLITLMSLSSLVFLEKWILVLSTLLLINFGMDSGAWFFGKNFGKHKLWVAVSPNKTIEGFIGGVFSAAVLGIISWKFVSGSHSWQFFGLFLILGALSQVGDLFQSKLKRQCLIKDSSNLIPGHGGIYDRVDSLVFLTPFFAIILKYA